MMDIEKNLGSDSTSVFSQNDNQSTVDLYQTKTFQEYQQMMEQDSGE